MANNWKAFSLRSGKRQGCLVSPLVFNTALEAVIWAKMQENETKVNWTEKDN